MKAAKKPARSHTRMDVDVKAVTTAARALRKSTPRMLRSNVEFVVAHLFNLPSYRLDI